MNLFKYAIIIQMFPKCELNKMMCVLLCPVIYEYAR